MTRERLQLVLAVHLCVLRKSNICCWCRRMTGLPLQRAAFSGRHRSRAPVRRVEQQRQLAQAQARKKSGPRRPTQQDAQPADAPSAVQAAETETDDSTAAAAIGVPDAGKAGSASSESDREENSTAGPGATFEGEATLPQSLSSNFNAASSLGDSAVRTQLSSKAAPLDTRAHISEVKAMAAKISAARRLARKLAEERASQDSLATDDENTAPCALPGLT